MTAFNFCMVVTTHMIHQMIREGQKKTSDKNKKLQNDLDSATLKHFLKNAKKSENKKEKIIS